MKRLWQFLALAVVLCGGWGSTYAQQAAPTALPPSSQLEIQSVAFDKARNSFPVTLLLTNQGLIWELDVKVESARAGVLAYQKRYAVQANIEIPAQDLTPGEEYQLTVTALNTSGQPIIGFVSNGVGSASQRVIQDDKRFTYPADAAPQLQILTVDLATINDAPAYLINITQQNTENIRAYRVWLEDETSGLRANVPEQLLATPLANPVTLPLVDLPTGRYRLIITALDANNTIIASDNRQGLTYTQPVPNIAETIDDNPGVVILLVIVTLVLLLVILYATVLKPKTREYQFGGTFNNHAQHMSGETEDRTIDRINRKKREKLRQRTREKQGYVQLEVLTGAPLGQNIPISKLPFSMGREGTDFVTTDGQVSKQHGYITQESGRYYFEDRSSNGSMVNGIKVHHARQALNDGDTINLSMNVQLRFRVIHPS